MTQSPTKSKLTNKHDYSSAVLHSALDDAKSYTDLFDAHMQTAQFDNHRLQSAERGYRRTAKIVMRIKSASKLVYGQPRVLTASCLPSETNPEIFNAFQGKTERIPELSSAFTLKYNEKKKLEARICQLKRLIMNEKKIKAKTSLVSCKHMNHEEQASHSISLEEEKIRQCRIEMNEVITESTRIDNQRQKLKLENQHVLTAIRNQNEVVDHLEKQVRSSRITLLEEERLLSKAKEAQTVAYKAMTNLFMHLNILKEEKAQLYDRIANDYM